MRITFSQISEQNNQAYEAENLQKKLRTACYNPKFTGFYCTTKINVAFEPERMRHKATHLLVDTGITK